MLTTPRGGSQDCGRSARSFVFLTGVEAPDLQIECCREADPEQVGNEQPECRRIRSARRQQEGNDTAPQRQDIDQCDSRQLPSEEQPRPRHVQNEADDPRADGRPALIAAPHQPTGDRDHQIEECPNRTKNSARWCPSRLGKSCIPGARPGCGANGCCSCDEADEDEQGSGSSDLGVHDRPRVGIM